MIANLIIRFLDWIIDTLGLPTLVAWLLLLVALQSVALGLADVIREFETGLLLTMAGLGLALGWGLAASPAPGWLAGIIGLILGVEFSVGRVGGLGGALVALLQALIDLARDLWAWPLAGRPDIGPVWLVLTELWTRVEVLLTRLYVWALALATGEPVFDPAAAALTWSLMLGGVAAWAGWVVRRRQQPLLALAPAGALLAMTLSYGSGQLSFLLPVLGATLLLLPLVGHQARERLWQAAGLDFSLDIRIDLALVVVPLALMLTAAAGLTPSFSIRTLTRFSQQLIWGRPLEAGPVAGSLGLKPPPAQPTLFDQVRAGGLPRRHLLGSGPELSERVVMLIQIEAEPGQSRPAETALGLEPSAAAPSARRFYWRSLTYDQYTGQGWYSGRAETIDYAAHEATMTEIAPFQQLVRQEVRALEDVGGLLYRAGSLVTVDQPYSVGWRAPGDVFGATVDSLAYQVDSLIPAAGETQLRATGHNYPREIQRRYLALPPDVPGRVLALARDLTATEPTPYDRARAIETYLRRFPYTLDLPAPPAGRDVADYFLFDLQQGYCDYYATAMVVLARAAGLPARLVIGYASGTYDEANGHYLITEADAHAWVELYFPGYGWIEFEPTAGRPALDRPAEAAPPLPPELATGPASIPARLLRPGGLWLGAGLAGLILLGLGGAAWGVIDAWRLRRLAPAAAIALLYGRLSRHGQRLAGPGRAGDTPYEFEASLAERLTSLAQERRWGAWLSPATQEVRRLTELYVQLSYSGHAPGPANQAQAIQTWRRLRRRLWLVWLSKSFFRR